MKPEKCPEAKHYEAYDWCELSDNICIKNTGNEDFDVDCEYYDEFLELDTHPIPEIHLAQQAQRDLHRQIYFRRDKEIRNVRKDNRS